MTTWDGWIIQDEAQEILDQSWSSLINRNFWELLYTQESEWDE